MPSAARVLGLECLRCHSLFHEPNLFTGFDPTDPATQWKDAGGQPLTVNDLAALSHLFDAFEAFQKAVEGLFLPVTTFAGL